jgi:alkylation response protein AidB-like acyl-CoA dehydrogenase
MDFGYNEIQELLRKGARDFLVNECPTGLVKKLVDDELGYDPGLWEKMADLGWMGLAFPEKYGGGGGCFLDLAVLLEEMGRVCLPGPFFSTVVLGGLTILDAGSEEQKKDQLSKIAGGKCFMTLALTEPSAVYSAKGIETQATREGDCFIISGTKLFVPDAHVADYIICVSRTKASDNAEQGVSLFLVDAKSPGVRITPLKTMAGDKQSEVLFDNVKVPAKNLIGELNKGWPLVQRIVRRAAIGKCADMVGGGQKVLEMTVDYVKQRIQFGRPVGSFQTIQNYCTQIAIDTETSKVITYEAAWKISEGNLEAREISMAKAWVSDAYKRIVSLGHQCHGGMAYMIDHDMHLYLKRAKADELSFGDADYQRELVAQEMGL